MRQEYHNPDSKRENVFRAVYHNPRFRDVLDKKNKPRVFPYLVDVEVTNHCNLGCVFCGQRLMTRKKGVMAFDDFKKVADECDKHSAPIRLIRWGEPFCHPGIMDLIGYVKTKKTIPVHVTTNGLVITGKKLRRLVELRLDSICFSFQGATKERYEIMRSNNKYEDLKSNILKLIEMRGRKREPFIQVSTSITDENEKEVDDFTRYWGSKADLVTVGKTNLSRLILLGGEGSDMTRKVKELQDQETIDKVYTPCKEVYQKLSVNYDGSVSACCSDFDNQLLVGDIHNSTLEKIWNESSSLKAFRALLDNMQLPSLTLCRACYATTKI